MGKKYAQLNMWKYASALEKLDCETIAHAIELISDCLKKGGKVITAGNGGSFSIAQHFAADMLKGHGVPPDKPRRVVALGTNTAALTALANDQGYDAAFLYLSRWEGLQKGDIIVLFSVSGNSQNLLRLIRNNLKDDSAQIISIQGSQRVYRLGDEIIIGVETSERGDDLYGVVEGVFSCIAHEIANRVKERLNE